MKSLFSLIIVVLSLALGQADAAQAESPPPPAGTQPTAAAEPAETEPAGGTGAQDEKDKDGKVVLTKEELEEKEGRKACKVEICASFRNPRVSGGDITCSVNKSWRKEQLVKMVAKLKVTWPYGPVRCKADIKLNRAELAKAMTEPKHTTKLDKHSVVCSIERGDDSASDIKMEFSPKLVFESGTAVSAKMYWGKIEAPALIKSAMWTATAADNTVNMLSGTLVEDINDFIGAKCDEVKEEWQANK